VSKLLAPARTVQAKEGIRPGQEAVVGYGRAALQAHAKVPGVEALSRILNAHNAILVVAKDRLDLIK
jgi:hypothetical protein